MGDLPGFSPTLGWTRHWVKTQESSADVTNMLVTHPPQRHNGNHLPVSWPSSVIFLSRSQDPKGSLLDRVANLCDVAGVVRVIGLIRVVLCV